MYVSFAAKSNGAPPMNAYDRQFTMLNLTTLFNDQQPSATLVADM